MMTGSMEDPAFASAVEAAYLARVARIPADTDQPAESLHAELLEAAIYKADPTNGGLRFKKLASAPGLDSRLLRALSNRLKG